MAWVHPLSDMELGPDAIRAVTDVLHSKWLSQGPRIAEFEQRFAEYVGARHAVALSSCTAALHLALAALDVQAGDEVLLPTYTFVATANAALYVGAHPVFLDIVGDADLNLDPDGLRGKLSPRTKAIIVVHLAGFPCDMDRVLSLAEEQGVPVIEDASHAIGARYRHAPGGSHAGKRAGVIGRIGCFSFFANKNLPVGEGGMLVTDDDAVAARVRFLRSHGMTRMSWEKGQALAMDYDVVELGYNYRMTEIAAALGLVQLEKLDRQNDTRRELVARYRELLEDVPQITVPFADRLEDSSHHIFPVLVDDPARRGEIRRLLADRGIQTSVHYPPVHRFSHLRQRYPELPQLPVSEAVAAREITLPLHPLMRREHVDEIVAALREVLGAPHGRSGSLPGAAEPATTGSPRR